jgi:hypothetical protein
MNADYDGNVMPRRCLILVAILGATTAAPARDTPSRGMPAIHVFGKGDTPDHADRAAIEMATNLIKDYLRDSHPDLLGTFPDRYLLKSKMLDRRGSAKQAIVDGQLSYQVEYVAEVNTRHLDGLREWPRAQVMQYRHREAAILLGGAVLALVVIGGALRLDTATRGYYSGRLLVTTTVLVAGIGWTAWQWL